MKKLILIIYVVFFAGCGMHLVPLRQDPVILALKETGQQAPFNITLAPITPIFNRDEYNNMEKRDEFGWVPEFDYVMEQQDIAFLFQEFSLFSKVIVSERDKSTDISSVLREAYQHNTDFVLRIELARYKVSFDRFSGSHMPTVICWFILATPTWFVHDEIYKSEVFFNVKLIDVYSNKIVFEKLYEGLEERGLNDFQRGWKIFGIFRIPEALREPNWKKIHKQLTPFALKDVKAKILESFKTGEFSDFIQRSTFGSETSKTAALCIGVSEFNDRHIPSLKYAARDGTLIHSILTNREKGTGINPGFCKLLKDQQATKSEILKNIQNMAVNRCGKNDTFLLYFSGYGYTENKQDGNPEGYLIPFDCDADRIGESAVSMSELKKLLGMSKAGRIILVFDCSFSGTRAGRSLSSKQTLKDYSFFNTLTSDSRIQAAVSASPGNNAYEFESLKHGLFTYYLAAGVLEKTADVNKDSIITLAEVYQFTKNNIYELSAYRGSRQTPVSLGKSNLNLVLYTPVKPKNERKIPAFKKDTFFQEKEKQSTQDGDKKETEQKKEDFKLEEWEGLFE